MNVPQNIKRKKGPFRDDMLVLSLAVLMVFVLYIAVDYPSTLAHIPGTNGTPGGGVPTGQNEPTIVKENVLDQDSHSNERQSTDVTLVVPWSNVTYLNLSLSWTDDIGSNDQFELKVLSDGNELGSGDSTSGNIILNIKAPTSGNLTAVVTCVKAPGLVDPSPIDRDTGNDWNLKVTADREVYE